MTKILIFILILCCTPLTLMFGPSTMYVDAKQPSENPITIKLTSSQAGPLESDSVRMGIPSVNYKGTILLHSPHPAFGGFSDLLVSKDRKSFLAVSDMGFWMKAEMKYSASGYLTGVSSKAQLGQLLNTDGKTYAIKFNADAEGLSRAPDSGYLVSFERVHRVNQFKNKDDLTLEGTPIDFKIPEKTKKMQENSGIESLLLLPDQTLFILAEGDERKGSLSYAAILEKSKWTEFNYLRSDDYRPTSAGNLPDNEILILERRYTGPGSLGIRFRKFSANKIEKNIKIIPEKFFELKPPIPRDNYEGLDTVTTADGRTYIYIISDDNFSPMQHTLLTLIELLPPDKK